MATHLSQKTANDPQASRVLLAILLTLAFFGLVGVSFSYYQPPAPSNTRGGTQVSLVVLNEAPPPYLSERQRQAQDDLTASLQAWVELLDPTTLLLPNERLGFSQVRGGELLRPLEQLAPLNATVAPVALSTFSEPPLSQPPPDLTEKSLAAWLATTPTMPEPAPAPAPSQGIYWEDPNGLALPEIPELAMATWLAEHPDTATYGPTTLLTQWLPGDTEGTAIHRVVVAGPSGSPALDQLALRHLQRYLLRLASLPDRSAAQDAWFAEARQVRVFWRHVPGIATMMPPIRSLLDAPTAP